MRLALSENRITKWKDIRHELTPRELTELIAFWSLEPWGDRRADIRDALMTSILAKVISGELSGESIDLAKLTNYIDAVPEESIESQEFQSPNCAAAMAAQHYPSTIK